MKTRRDNRCPAVSFCSFYFEIKLYRFICHFLKIVANRALYFLDNFLFACLNDAFFQHIQQIAPVF